MGINDGAVGPASPTLQHVVTVCGNGTCPTLYRTDRGTFVVQGYPVDAAGAGVTPGPGELLVEVPAGLLESLAARDD